MASTLSYLVTTIRQRSDFQTSQFIDNNEFTGYLNASLSELHGLIVNSYGGQYFMQELILNILPQGVKTSTNLPDDVYKVLGIDLLLSPYPTTNRITLERFNWNERNRPNALRIAAYATQFATNIRYAILGQEIRIAPPSNSQYELAVWYIPTAPQFFAGTLGTITGSPGASGVVTLTAAPKFQVGQAVSKYVSGFPTGTTFYVIAVGASTVTLSASYGGPAANLTGFFFSGDTLYSATPDLTQTLEGATTLEGWLEYVITDVCIKALGKQDTDASVFIRQKAMLTERINNEAQNRNIGSPGTVQDIYASGTLTDMGWGPVSDASMWTY